MSQLTIRKNFTNGALLALALIGAKFAYSFALFLLGGLMAALSFGRPGPLVPMCETFLDLGMTVAVPVALCLACRVHARKGHYRQFMFGALCFLVPVWLAAPVREVPGDLFGYVLHRLTPLMPGYVGGLLLLALMVWAHWQDGPMTPVSK